MMFRNFALFAYGFRPFFLACAFHAMLMVPLFLIMLHGNLAAPPEWDVVRWHIHEMLFGFIAAAVAGFVLTAVPNWTGQRGYAGRPLIGLFILWAAPRIALLPFLGLPLWLGGLLDLIFMPSLLLSILPSLIKAKNRRNYIVAGMLLLYWLADIFCWLDILLGYSFWSHGIDLGFDAVLLLVVVIGGRVVPSFTSSFLHRLGQEPNIRPGTLCDRIAIALILALTVVHQCSNNAVLIGLVAGAAAIAHFMRLSQWHGLKTLSEPLLWLLHVAYLWIPVALTLHAVHVATNASFASAWRHAFSLGSFATMIFAIMCRAALGHTGRALRLGKPMVIASYALIAAGIIRVFVVPTMNGNGYFLALSAAACLWWLAFSLYCVVYTPILMRPRPDGRPG